MQIINALTNLVVAVSGVLWFLSTKVNFPEPKGILSDLDPRIARQHRNAQHAQARLSRWAAALTVIAGLLALIVLYLQIN
jgi:hypothetical protein